MRLYLVQHAEARKEDPRPLTERGKEEAERVASFLVRAGVRIDRIVHSGKLRALQTAEIMAEKLKAKIEQADALDPSADPRIWAERLLGVSEDIMIVGHLPHLSKLASLLLTGSEENEPIKFRMAGVVCLESEGGKWSVLWAIVPELIP